MYKYRRPCMKIKDHRIKIVLRFETWVLKEKVREIWRLKWADVIIFSIKKGRNIYGQANLKFKVHILCYGTFVADFLSFLFCSVLFLFFLSFFLFEIGSC